MKRNLEAQYKELEEKRRVYEDEKANWEAQQRILEQQKLDASKSVTLRSYLTIKVQFVLFVLLHAHWYGYSDFLHRTMEKNKKKGKIFWRETRPVPSLLQKKLIYSPSPLKFASTVVLRTYTHINRYEAHHIPQHPSVLHLTCTTCDMIAIYTHTHKHIQMPTCSSLCRVSLHLLKPFLSMGNACFCEILFSYISWQRGEARVPLSYSMELTHGRDHA